MSGQKRYGKSAWSWESNRHRWVGCHSGLGTYSTYITHVPILCAQTQGSRVENLPSRLWQRVPKHQTSHPSIHPTAYNIYLDRYPIAYLDSKSGWRDRQQPLRDYLGFRLCSEKEQVGFHEWRNQDVTDLFQCIQHFEQIILAECGCDSDPLHECFQNL